jgi:MFS family permease
MDERSSRRRRNTSPELEQKTADECVDDPTAATAATLMPAPKHRITPTTTSLPLIVFIDMLGVSLVVPLLFQYYRKAGIASANQRELLSSVFSFSQIIGGIVLGVLTDAKILKRKTILLISFGGSAIAYAMIVYGEFRLLVVSRILVGLVKQTMTVTTSILTQCTTDKNRAKYMGRLESSATAAWIVGPSVGALMFKFVDHKAPALLASLLFVFNMILTALVLDDTDEGVFMGNDIATSFSSKSIDKNQSKSNFVANLKYCFSSKQLGSVIASILVFSWITRATSYSSLGTYYEDLYGVEPHHRGYIQSYQRVLGFIVQSSLIGPLLTRLGGERQAVCLCSIILAIATFMEIQQSISLFLMVLSPAIAITMAMMHVSLRSLLTRQVPKDSVFSVFAALDVLKNASAVTVPFYRTFLFQILGSGWSTKYHQSTSGMEGDPEPIAWVLSSGIHWVFAFVTMTYFLSPKTTFISSSFNDRTKGRKQV